VILDTIVAALSWDPQVKGGLIIFGSVMILCGSVYLILATNTGARLGFLLAATGLAGWMLIMGIVWATYGIGLKGREPHWKVKTTVQGDVGKARAAELEAFPNGWKALKLDDPETAEAQAAVDAALVPPADSGQQGLFKSTTDYQAVAAYDLGGEKYFLTLRHKPHFFVLQVQGVVRETPVPGQPPRVRPDPGAPVVSTLLVRDLGSLRVPGAVVMVSSLILFVLLVWVLHTRDKEIMARAQETADA
jgi:hypothetical protein